MYAEILVAPFRSGGDAVAAVEGFLSDLGVRTESVSAGIARGAALLRSGTRSLRLPDALVLATGEELGAERILTGDEAWAAISRRVTVVRAH